MGKAKVEAFLTHLAVDGQVAASTPNQALNALPFLYRAVLDRPLLGRINAVRADRPERLPLVLTRDEVEALLDGLDGVHRLAGHLLYGAGLRLMECPRRRIKDIDFGQNHLVVRDGKGPKDRTTVFPIALRAGGGVPVPPSTIRMSRWPPSGSA